MRKCGGCEIPAACATGKAGKNKNKQKNIGVVFLQKEQEHGEAGTAKQGTERSL
jgi:hypothetical protein